MLYSNLHINIKKLLLSLLLLLPVFVIAQTSVIKGIITDEVKSPVEGAAVVLHDADDAIISYTITDQLGAFYLENDVQEGYYLQVTHITYLRQQKTIQKKSATTIYVLDFTLQENENALNEVIIFSSNTEKDTVRLDLEKLNLQENDNLKDILSKIPNFKLGKKGNIIYKGKSIDKILVNNKSSFVNQNNLALESIENRMVEGIDIINNYTNTFKIDFEEQTESVLNINTKKSAQNIVTGAIEAKYGYDNKYEGRVKGFLFSNTANIFLINNTNNIGKSTLNFEEINTLFSEEQSFSNYHINGLNTIFSSNENLKKDFFSNTNLTFRNQGKRLKTSGLFYYFAPEKINSTRYRLTTLDNVSLLNSEDEATSKANSFLGTLTLAYKIAPKTIVEYSINTNFINTRNASLISNELVAAERTNTIHANNDNAITSVFNQLSLTSKLNAKTILGGSASLLHEKSGLLNDYTITDDSGLTSTQFQDYDYKQDVFYGSSYLKYRTSHAFIPSLKASYKTVNEKIEDNNASATSLIDRTLNTFSVQTEITGKDKPGKIEYHFSLGIDAFSNTTNLEKKEKTFIPLAFDFEYENKLHRYYINYSRALRANDIAAGITTIEPFHTIFLGNDTLPLTFTKSNKTEASYTYSNIFDAELFAISFNYNTYKDAIRRSFISQENGVSTFQNFVADRSFDYTLRTSYAKTVFQLKYPTKIDFDISYTQNEYPTIIADDIVKIKTRNVTPKLSFETITKQFINFKLNSSLAFVTDKAQGETYNASYLNNSFSMLIKNKAWRGSLTFLYDHNRINDINYSRKNINLDLAYTHNKLTLTMEARHIGELFSLFENDTYNSSFTIRDGLSSVLINNRSLNYLIFGIKYNL